MRDKNVAALLAFFLGAFGVHRFYLGQAGYGIMYILLLFVGIAPILAMVDFVRFLLMSHDTFDFKYNKEYLDIVYRDTDFNRGRNQTRGRHEDRGNSGYGNRDRQKERHRRRQENIFKEEKTRQNPYKVSGKQLLKDYEYEEAVKDLRKALNIEPKDGDLHLDLASAYSLLEQKDEGFFHLKKAIDLGAANFSMIQKHEDLAFLRTQPEYENLERQFLGSTNNIDVKAKTSATLNTELDLLEQIKMLGDLKSRGLLTEEEFVAQKKKLLR